MDRIAALKQSFAEIFNIQADFVCHAPGRVNLMGDHTDYNNGYVLPVAINFGTDIAASKREDRQINVVALDLDNSQVSFSLDDIQFDDIDSWSNYVRGSLLALTNSFPHISGANLVVSGNVPQGAGLSSSASFEIAILSAFTQLYDLPLTGIDAALKGQQAENDFVGCNCGIMDQLISALGKKAQVMLLDCQDLTVNYAKIPEELSILIVNSNVKRGLVDSEYNTRRAQCEQVAEYFGKSSLRAVTLAELEQNKDDIGDILYQRAHHVLSENSRTIEMLTALNNQDISTISLLMEESHRSLKENFGVSTAEVDILVDILADSLKDQGGVRMTGGGFGGCVVTLAPKSLIPSAKDAVLAQYQRKTGLVPDIYQCKTVDGAFINLS